MSGHSKWATIKHQKGAADAKRGQLFTKLSREIIVAVREGGGASPDSNFRLRLAVQKARDNSMPMENIERAIKKGSGEGGAETLAEMTLEGYAPGGAAVMVRALSDNRNRTVQEVRNLFSRSGGNLGESGCVAWLFDLKGLITVNAGGRNVDELTLKAIDAGADDVVPAGDVVEIYTKADELEMVRKALEAQNVAIASAEQSLVAKTTISLEEKAALQTLKLMEKLEDLDEVQQVYSNVDFSDDIIAKYHSQA
jgi:YebC/PmpR family DNA-binding regulatory protein